MPHDLLMDGVNDVVDDESDLRSSCQGGVEGVVGRAWVRAAVAG